jgi:hypothetical protein
MAAREVTYTPASMAKRRRRDYEDEYDDDDEIAPKRRKARPRRWGVFSLAGLVVLGACAWMAPAVLVHTELRDKPLVNGFAGIDGSIASGSATWTWMGPIEYRNVVLRDAAGLPAVIVRSIVVEKGILGLVADPKNLGTVRLAGVEAAVMVRRDGSSLEDILAPWLAAPRDGSGIACDLEVVGGTVDLVDTARSDTWRLVELFGVGTLRADGIFHEWTAAGRLRHGGTPLAADAPPLLGATQDPPPRLDRATIPAATAAVLARDGGWSISASGESTIAVTANRLPLGGSSVLATRMGNERLLDGLADVRLDVSPGATGTEIRGRVVVEQLAVCRADTLAEEFTVSRGELPLHVSTDGNDIIVHELSFTSPVARGEITGRLPWPAGDSWSWLEQATERDWTLVAKLDLAAASRSLPGGLAVRPDVKVTGGSLQFSAATRRDGTDRVLEAKLEARDLAAVRDVAATGPDHDATSVERPLRWNDPLTGWLRARRGPGRGSMVFIEECRLNSPSFEAVASGTPAALELTWTVDLGGLMKEVAEIVDTGGTLVAGTCRGRLGIDRAPGLTSIKTTASFSDFQWAAPGREIWEDEAIAIEAEASGSFSTDVAMIEKAQGVVTARGDSLKATLAGGAVVDIGALLGGNVASAIRPAGRGDVSADCSIVGDVARWQRRLAVVMPALGTRGLELAGTLQAAAAVAAAGDAWRITKAGGEIERFSMAMGERRTSEPRVVATAAGMVRPTTGSIEISSAELLSSTLSLRTGGVSWSPSEKLAEHGPLDVLLHNLRGRVQWQADLARVEPWLVAEEYASRWPLAGRAWGTLDVAQTQNGLTMLVEATGSQVTIAEKAAGVDGNARTIWTEPQATVAFEVTRPLVRTPSGGLTPSKRLVIDRLELASSTVAMAARGAVGDTSARRQASLEGTVSYDWEQLSRLATPWTGGKVRVVGSGGRPFAARVTRAEVTEMTPTLTSAPQTPNSLPLPDAWLSAIRSAPSAIRAAPNDPIGARAVVRPPSTAAATSRTLAEQLAGLSFETSAAWTSADIDGLPVAAGEIPVRLVEGQLAFGPFDVAAGGGRIRGAPWIKLVPAPGELVVPPGRVVERLALTGPLCSKAVALVSPLLAGTTQTSGLVTVDLAGARLPLGDLLGGEAGGQVTFEQLEVTPSGGMQPLVNLLARLQAVIDPRFVLGDKVVLLRVRPDPIRIRLVNRRLWHEGLVMDAGQLTVSSRGSVGEDGSLAAVVEVAFRGDVAGQTPVVAQLLRTPIAIPLKGTVARPQFDAGAMDMIVKRIVENTAQAVFRDGLGRGIDALLGNPQPAPLTLPP